MTVQIITVAVVAKFEENLLDNIILLDTILVGLVQRNISGM